MMVIVISAVHLLNLFLFFWYIFCITVLYMSITLYTCVHVVHGIFMLGGILPGWTGAAGAAGRQPANAARKARHTLEGFFQGRQRNQHPDRSANWLDHFYHAHWVIDGNVGRQWHILDARRSAGRIFWMYTFFLNDIH